MLKSTFSGLQLTTVAIFIRSAVFAAKICKIPRNSPKIRTYRIAVKVIQGYRSWCLLIGQQSRSSKVIDLGVNACATSYLSLIVYFGRISYHFQDIDAFSSKIACFPHPNLVLWPLRRNALRIYTKCIRNFLNLLITNSNFGRISYSFRDIGALTSNIACFPTQRRNGM